MYFNTPLYITSWTSLQKNNCVVFTVPILFWKYIMYNSYLKMILKDRSSLYSWLFLTEIKVLCWRSTAIIVHKSDTASRICYKISKCSVHIPGYSGCCQNNTIITTQGCYLHLRLLRLYMSRFVYLFIEEITSSLTHSFVSIKSVVYFVVSGRIIPDFAFYLQHKYN
jgi:hypothetical protein